MVYQECWNGHYRRRNIFLQNDLKINNIEVLDCTLRDGGFALEEKQNSVNEYYFSETQKYNFIENMCKTNIEIIEIGSLDLMANEREKYSVYPNFEKLPKYIFCKNDKIKYAFFFRGPDVPLNAIPERSDRYCDIIRLSIRYSEMDKSLEYCRTLREKGYEVSLQPTVTIRYTDDDLKKIANCANAIGAYSIYLVDSYGSMDEKEIDRIGDIYKSELDSTVKIGFHAHNNLGKAMMNTHYFVNKYCDRDLIVDSCCQGLGQGAGNLQTEVLVNYLNNRYDKNYNFSAVLEACEVTDKFYEKAICGYSLPAMIAAVYGAAYKYGIYLREVYGFTFSEIAKMLEKMPNDMKYRFMKDKLEKMIN